MTKDLKFIIERMDANHNSILAKVLAIDDGKIDRVLETLVVQ